MSHNEFLPYAPSTLGQQVHVHHCKPGPNNDRLYIRRNTDGSVVAFCHHCGEHGYAPGSRRAMRRAQREQFLGTPDATGKREVKLPSDFTTDLREWSSEAKAWVLKYGITEDELHNNGVGYSESLGAVVLPVFSAPGELAYFQYRPFVRQVFEDHRGSQAETRAGRHGDTRAGRSRPKYVTVCESSSERRRCLLHTRSSWSDTSSDSERRSNSRARPIAVLVEDALSAIKVSRVPGHVGVALMGSTLSVDGAADLASKYDQVVVFLDNDNDQVKEKQRDIQKMVEPLIGTDVRIILSNRDPKEHNTRELFDLLGVPYTKE